MPINIHHSTALSIAAVLQFGDDYAAFYAQHEHVRDVVDPILHPQPERAAHLLVRAVADVCVDKEDVVLGEQLLRRRARVRRVQRL